MGDDDKVKMTFQIKINQECKGLDDRNTQYIDVWVPKPKVNPDSSSISEYEYQRKLVAKNDEIDRWKAAFNSTQVANTNFREEIAALRNNNRTLIAEIDKLRRDLAQATDKLSKIESINVPF